MKSGRNFLIYRLDFNSVMVYVANTENSQTPYAIDASSPIKHHMLVRSNSLYAYMFTKCM